MSLEDSAYTSTPTIVRDDGRFVGLTVTGTTSLNSLGISGAATFSGTNSFVGNVDCSGDVTFSLRPGTADNVLAVNISSTFGAQSRFNAALLAYGSVILGNTSSQTLTVNATETHNSAETHNGTETHNGAVYFATDAIRETYQDISLGDGTILAYDSHHINIITMSTTGSIVLMATPDASKANRSKIIKNPYTATNSFRVVDQATSSILADLQPGQECTVVSTSTRWI